MPLTLEQVKSAFHDSIPHRRDEFSKTVRQRFTSMTREAQYQLRYPAEVLAMAEAEIHERHRLAHERIKQLLDSGWRPENPTSIRSAYTELFTGFDDWRKDPSSDLYYAVKSSFAEVGLAPSDKEIQNVRRLGTVQVDAGNEYVSDLVVYAARYTDFSNVPQGMPATSAPAKRPDEARWSYDAFVSHASEDKESFVNDLVDALRTHGLRIWYDAYELKIGDSLRESIDRGLLSSQYGIVILSPSFFAKDWPKNELEGLIARQSIDGVKVILPIWHDIDAARVAQVSPILAGRLAAKSSDGLGKVVQELLSVIRPQTSSES